MIKDPRSILGLVGSVSKRQVKERYRELAAKTHPDRGGDGGKFDEITKAYRVLVELAPNCADCADSAVGKDGLLCKCKIKPEGI